MLINLSSAPASALEVQEVPLASPFDLLTYRSRRHYWGAPLTWALAAWALGAMELHVWLVKSDISAGRHRELQCELETAPKFDPAA